MTKFLFIILLPISLLAQLGSEESASVFASSSREAQHYAGTESDWVGAGFASLMFYGQPVELNYNAGLFDRLIKPLTDAHLRQYYENQDPRTYHATLQQLLLYKEKLRLNDWLYYLLIQEVASSIYPEEYDVERTLFSWVFLARSGYKVQLNYHNTGLFLSVYTLDRLYDLPVKRHGLGWMAELSQYKTPQNDEYIAALRSDYYINTTEQAFKFQLSETPLLTGSEIEEIELSFSHRSKNYQLQLSLDRTMIDIMKDYPELTVKSHSKIPISDLGYQSLIQELNRCIGNMDELETLRFLLSFTRQAFQYKEDDKTQELSTSRTFCPEETLYHRYSDCEDRVVLFSYLVRELLQLDVIMIDYEDHAAVGVKLDKMIGKPIFYKGEFYTFCEPTGPEDILEVGQYPEGFMEKTYRIMIE